MGCGVGVAVPLDADGVDAPLDVDGVRPALAPELAHPANRTASNSRCGTGRERDHPGPAPARHAQVGIDYHTHPKVPWLIITHML